MIRRVALGLALTGCARTEPTASEPIATASPPPAAASPPVEAEAVSPRVDPPRAPEPAAVEPAPTRAFDDVKGMSEAELVAHWGEPPSRAGERWTYRFPPGCSDEKDVYVVRVRAGKVTDVEHRREHTGRICE